MYDIPSGYRLESHDTNDYLSAYRKAVTSGDFVVIEQLRSALRGIESGRFYDSLAAIHKQVSHADTDERRTLKGLYSEETLRWVAVYGMVEDLNTHPDITGIERPE